MNKLITTATALVLAGSTMACNRGGTANAGAPANNAAAAANAANATAPTAQPDAQSEVEVRAYLDQIYANYATEGGEGADYQAFIEPQLAAAIAGTEGGPGADPFIDAQDWTPFGATYENIQVNGDRAIATATFNNGEARTQINYQLLRTPAGWRAYDIQNGAGASLRERIMNAAR